MPRTPEAADSEIKENYDDDCRRNKRPVIGTMQPARPCSPHEWSKHQHRQQKENAHDLQPDFAADTAERLKESAQSARHATRCLPGGSTARCGIRLRRSRLRRARLRLVSGRVVLLTFAHDGLARKTSRHPHAHAQHPAYSLRSHSFTIPASTQGARPLRAPRI